MRLGSGHGSGKPVAATTGARRGVPVNSRGVAVKRPAPRGAARKKGGAPGKSRPRPAATIRITPIAAPSTRKGQDMNRPHPWTRTTVRLPRDGLLGIDDGRGLRLRVAAGTVWLTQHDDGRDLVLRAGECFVIDRPGRTVVQALDPAELALNAANDAHCPPPSHTRLKGLA
jgi:hypothetical protein